MSTSCRTVGASKAKTKFAELLELAAAGETITITKYDEPVAMLVPVKTPGRVSLDVLFREMDDIRERSVLNVSGKPPVSIKQLIEEGRK
jgi:prevent-host-death family protein